MLTIFVSPRNNQITTADGQVMTVKGLFVSEAGGLLVCLTTMHLPTW